MRCNKRSPFRFIPAAVVAASFAVLCAAARAAGPVNIALVPVGDAGNVADPATGYGSVSYAYSMGEFDVTMGQYTAFLNSVAATDSYALYNTSMATATPTYGILRTSTTAGYAYSLASSASANVPVNFVSWGGAARFVNWLQNGEPVGLGEVNGSTETGTYAMDGGTTNAALMVVTRSSTATWVLPTVDEWYKSAYYAGAGTGSSYWFYPTQSNNIPSNVLSAAGTNNANYSGLTGDADPHNLLTPVGFFAASPGPYGTFDQGGDVWQWTETANLVPYNVGRYCYGGSWAGPADGLRSDFPGSPPPTAASRDQGFRVASLPEPAAAVILVFGICLCAIWGLLSSLMSPRRSVGSDRAQFQPRQLTIEGMESRDMLSSLVQYNPAVSPNVPGSRCQGQTGIYSTARVSWQGVYALRAMTYDASRGRCGCVQGGSR